MTTLKTLLPRKSPAVDLPPGLHRFLKEWERQLLKSDKPPHREVAKVLKLKDSTVSTYKLRLIAHAMLYRTGSDFALGHPGHSATSIHPRVDRSSFSMLPQSL